MQPKVPEITEERSPSDQETDAFEVSDQAQPWRRSRTPKVRSRSLQPRERSLENLPWLRGKRDNSVPKQDTFLQGKTKEPVRPWIEEVIKLKRTELQRKVIEHEKLEKVDLKESHIEHHEIPKEELELVDLKCVQYPVDHSKFGHLPQQGAMQDSGLSVEEMTQERQEAIEITKQIDNLIQTDTSKAVPWEIQKQQLKTIERAQKIIDKFKVEEVDLDDRRRQQEIIQQQHLQRISNQEDKTLLTREEQIAIQTGKVKSRAAHGKPTQLPQKVQPFSETEDIALLTVSEDTQLDMRKIEQMEQDTPVMWQRGQKQKTAEKGALSHVEDTTILTVKERQEITERPLETQETPVGWRRGAKQRAGELGRTEESTVLEVEQTEEGPQPIQRQQSVKQAATSSIQHVEDTTVLDVKRREEVDQKVIQTEEKPVGWRRGPKQRAGELSHTEESTVLEVEQTQEAPQPKVVKRRGSAKQTPAQHVEEVTVSQVDQKEDVPTEEVPVGWRRGPKPKKVAPQLEEQEVEEQQVEQVVDQSRPDDKTVPWMRGKSKPQPEEQQEHPHEVKLKQAPRKSIDKTKEPHEMTELKLKPVARQPKPEPIKPVEEQPEELQPQLADIVPSDSTHAVTWQAEEIGPLDRVPKEKPVEEVPQRPKEEITPIEPEELEKAPWKRDIKKKLVEEQPEEKQWPSGKRKPKQPEEEEKVELKPIPRKKPEKKESEEKPDKIAPKVPIQPEEVDEVELEPIPRKKPEKKKSEAKPTPKVDRAEVVDERTLAEETTEIATFEEAPELAAEIEDTELPKAKAVKAVVKPPRFTKKLQPEICKPDEPCVLKAHIDGVPLPEVRWLLDDVELRASEQYEMNVIEKVATLRIDRVTPSDVGVYTCEIRNEAGVAMSRANIVIGKLRSLSDDIFQICIIISHVGISLSVELN